MWNEGGGTRTEYRVMRTEERRLRGRGVALWAFRSTSLEDWPCDLNTFEHGDKVWKHSRMQILA